MRFWSIFVLSAIVVASFLAMLVSANEGMPTPPVRPQLFKSPTDLRDYLQKLNEYYAIVGRPR